MILLNYKKCNTFLNKNEYVAKKDKLKQLEEYIKEYENENNYGYLICPNCESDKLILWGKYSRNIGIYGVYYSINIRRVKCKECNKTHALIPSFIMPYFQNEISFIEVAIAIKEEDNNTINEISSKLNITRQIINQWLKRFRNHLSRLKTTISNDINVIINELFNGIEIRLKYSVKNGIRFLQKVPT